MLVPFLSPQAVVGFIFEFLVSGILFSRILQSKLNCYGSNSFLHRHLLGLLSLLRADPIGFRGKTLAETEVFETLYQSHQMCDHL